MNNIVHYVSCDLYTCLISFFLNSLALFIFVSWERGGSQRSSHKHSSQSNLSPYSLDSLPCLSGEHRAWVQHCWRGRQSSYWGGPQHLHHQDHPRGCCCRGRETEVSVYIILQGSKCMNNFAGSLTVFEDSRVVLLDLLKLIGHVWII